MATRKRSPYKLSNLIHFEGRIVGEVTYGRQVGIVNPDGTITLPDPKPGDPDFEDSSIWKGENGSGNSAV